MDKRCGCCKATKPAAEYMSNKARKDGLTQYCKDCMRAKQSARNQGLRSAWTAEEDEILFDHYQRDGGPYCVARLPGRTLNSVSNRAWKIGAAGGQSQAQWPRGIDAADSKIQVACDLALNNWPALAPANDLFWRIGA